MQDCFMLQKLWDLCCDERYDLRIDEIDDVNLKNRVLKCRILIRKCVDEAHRKECTGQYRLFSDITPAKDTVITADGSKSLIEGVGTCRLISQDELFKLERTLYIPDFK